MSDLTRAEIGNDQNAGPTAGDLSGASAGGIARSAGRFARLRRRYADLKIGGRLTLGFAVVFGLVLALTVSGLIFLQAVLSGVDGFSRRGELAGAAAELDIGLRRLEIAVRDQLAEGDVDSFEEASHHRDGMVGRLDALAAAADGTGDVRAVADARAALTAYWDGFRRIVDLKEAQAELTGRDIPALSASIQAALGQLKDIGGVDSATLANEAGRRITGALELGLRFADRRDMMDGEKAQAEFAAIRERLLELNRYRWVAGAAAGLAEVNAGIDRLEAALDRLDGLAVERDAVRTDVLVPNAAVISERAQSLRQAGEREAAQLRGDLRLRAGNFANVALWVGGGVLLVGGAAAWWTARSVSRPVQRLARTMALVAAGGDDGGTALAAGAHNDEIADLARALTVVRDNTGQMSRALTETVAERDRLAAELQRLLADNAAKSDFMVNLGQLLHGPLNDMAAQAQELMTDLHGHGLVELANNAENIQWTGERLAGQLDALMDYARIEAGRMELCLQDFDVARLVIEARERVVAAADLHGVALTASAAPGVGGMHSDFDKVRRTLLNLLDNACAYAGRDNGDGAVSLLAERVERDGRGWIAFTVSDNGPGFVASQASHLFRPFVQGAKAGKGAGLGLTLAAHYLAQLGGELEVTAAPAKGARFRVLLPAVYAAEDEARSLRVRVGAPGASLSAPMALLPSVGQM